MLGGILNYPVYGHVVSQDGSKKRYQNTGEIWSVIIQRKFGDQSLTAEVITASSKVQLTADQIFIRGDRVMKSYLVTSVMSNQDFLNALSNPQLNLKDRVFVDLFRIITINGQPIALHIIQNGSSSKTSSNNDPEMLEEGMGYQLRRTTAGVKDERFLGAVSKAPKLLVSTRSKPIATTKKDAVSSSELSLDDLSLQSDPLTLERSFKNHAWSFHQYMTECLYNPSYGYYSAGKSKIGEWSQHFETAATENTCLAKQVCVHTAMMDKMMRDAGDLSAEECFEFIEIGGGNGKFSDNFLSFLEGNHIASELLDMFSKRMHYTIIDISPTQVELIKKQNQRFIEAGKLSVIQGDAKNLSKVLQKPVKGVIFSNELWDNLPCQQVRVNSQGKKEVLCLVPTFKDKEQMTGLTLQKIDQFIAASAQYKQQYSKLLELSVTNKDCILLKGEDVNQLPPILLPKIEWKHVYLPLELFPDVVNYFKNGGINYFKDMKPGEGTFLQPDIQAVLNGMDHILEKGFVLSCDYGNASYLKKNANIRTFPQHISDPSQDFHTGFGQTDLTICPDFTSIAEMGVRNGLDLIGMGKQPDLIGVIDDLNVDSITVRSLSGSFDAFRFLLQQKQRTKAPFTITAPMIPLKEDQTDEEANFISFTRLYSKAYRDFKKGEFEKIPGKEESDLFVAYISKCYDESILLIPVLVHFSQFMKDNISIQAATLQLEKNDTLSDFEKRLIIKCFEESQ